MLIYIMSRPHSGSTILNILLGNSRQIVSVGQLVSDMGRLENYCSCGELISDCGFWQEVRQRVENEGISWSEAVEQSVGQAHINALWKSYLAGPNDRKMQRLADVTAVVDRAIRETAGKAHLCDSSKETTRGLFLLRYYDQARVIFLVRDPRASVASHYWRFKANNHFHFLRRDHRVPTWMGPIVLSLAAASWTVGNLLGELARRAAPERVLTLRYEDLRDQPGAALKRIEEAWGIDLNDVIDHLDREDVVEIGHNIGGNGVRLERGLRFDPQKEQSRPPLPQWLFWTTLAFCWPLMGRYGYRLRRNEPPRATGQQSQSSPSASA